MEDGKTSEATDETNNLMVVQTSNIVVETVQPPLEERLTHSYYPDVEESTEKITVIEFKNSKTDIVSMLINNTDYEPPTASLPEDPEARQIDSVELFLKKINIDVSEPLGIERVMSDTMMRKSTAYNKQCAPPSAVASAFARPGTTATMAFAQQKGKQAFCQPQATCKPTGSYPQPVRQQTSYNPQQGSPYPRQAYPCPQANCKQQPPTNTQNGPRNAYDPNQS